MILSLLVFLNIYNSKTVLKMSELPRYIKMEKAIITGSREDIVKTTPSHDGSQCARLMADGKVLIVNKHGEPINSFNLPNDDFPSCFCFLLSLKLIVIGSSSGRIYIYDISSGSVVFTLGDRGSGIITLYSRETISTVWYIGGFNIATYSEDGVCKLWNVSPIFGISVRIMAANGLKQSSMTCNIDGSIVVIGYESGHIVVWKTHESTQRLFYLHTCAVTAVDMKLDSLEIVSGSEDGIVKTCNLSFSIVTIHHNCGSVISAIRISENGLLIAVGLINGQVLLIYPMFKWRYGSSEFDVITNIFIHETFKKIGKDMVTVYNVNLSSAIDWFTIEFNP